MNVVLRALHLCSGYGGFELALNNAQIPNRTACHVEWDPYAAAVLVARMAEARLDQAPIYSDLTTFDGRPLRGRVDLITAGLPCQPFSGAGNRHGLEDPRHLWPHAYRIIGEVRPRLVLLENVPDVVRAGWLTHVLADLAEDGFDAEWGMLSAAAIGAPHKRERFWLLAYTRSEGRPEIAGRLPADAGTDTRAHRSSSRNGQLIDSRGEDVAYTTGERGVSRDGPAQGRQDRRRFAQASHRHVWPPTRDDQTGWAQYLAKGGPEPAVRRGADGAPRWLADRLHLGGNGLVPQAAAHALLTLAKRAHVNLFDDHSTDPCDLCRMATPIDDLTPWWMPLFKTFMHTCPECDPQAQAQQTAQHDAKNTETTK